MKIMKRIISWMGAKGLRHLPILGVALFASAGCSQDPLLPGGGSDGRVQFVPTTGGSWTATRAAAPADTTLRCAVYPLEGTSQGDTLYLHATVSEREEAATATETAATAGTAGTAATVGTVGIAGTAAGTAETAATVGIAGTAAGIAGAAATRGTCVDNTTFHSSIGVYAFAYAGTWNDSRVADYMNNVEVTQASGWTTSYFWPGDRFTMRFFAYAPYGCGGLTPPAAGAQGTPQLRYRVAEQVADQQDLLAAWTGEVSGAGTATQPLAFRHALTAVRFATGNQILAGRISKITLRGVYASGRYTPNENGTGTWDDLGDVSDFSVTVSVPVGGTPDQPVTAPAETFLMIPQTLPQGAAVEIEYTDNISQQTRTLTAQIGGEVWPEGKSVTFRISTSNIIMTPTLTVTPPANYTYDGGDGTYQVTSYVTLTLPGGVQVKQPAAWTAEFYAYDAATGTFDSTPLPQRPSWITAFTESGAGGVTAQSYQASVAMQVGITQPNPHNDILQQAAPVSGTYDLSTQGGTTAMNTANCYVINAPGEYSLPLVYGNAIKNGATNSSAYTSSATGSYVLKKFVNHLNAAITNPYIYNNANCVPDNAVLVWQDEKDLVTNVALTADKQHLTFEVPQATIQQGNAIVAVRDASNTILWSWHIWVTDFVPGLPATVETSYNPDDTQRDKVVTNYQGVSYTFMGVNIGWCDRGTKIYDPRQVKVVLSQPGNNITADFVVSQLGYTDVRIGDSPYFEWGRKDPMLSSNGAGGKKSCYSTANYSFFEGGTGQVSIGLTIKNPYVFYNSGTSNDFDWCATTYYNLWSVNNTTNAANDNKVIKTVYDPSPVGYCLPASNVFTGCVYNGKEVDGIFFGKRFNSPYASVTDFTNNHGWTFYCNKMPSYGNYNTNGGVIFFLALGYRSRMYGNIGHFNDTCLYWTAIPYSESTGF